MRRPARLCCVGAVLLSGIPSALAEPPQPLPQPKPKPETSQERVVIDILMPPAPTAAPDTAERAARECAAQRDAAIISGAIVVCRELPREDMAGVDPEAAERRRAEASQGIKPSDVEGGGGHLLYRAEGSVFMVGVKTRVGKAAEPPLIIDVTALPQAPP